MLGFCLNDVIMTAVCRPETVVFSPLMLLPGLEADNKQLRDARAQALGERRAAEILGRPGDTPRRRVSSIIGPC